MLSTAWIGYNGRAVAEDGEYVVINPTFRKWALVVAVMFAGTTMKPAPLRVEEITHAKARQAMVAEINALAEQTAAESGRPQFSEKVMGVMGRLPRHRFVPAALADEAYENIPLPIGYGQTISQPYIVALMTDLLDITPDTKVLEIGTGSGYQAAVMAALGAQVFTIEIVPQLGEQASQRFDNLGLKNIQTKIGDGYFGWKKEMPFDRIIVTAAAGHVPPPLIRQLKAGGRMVIPVGRPYWFQFLTMIDKSNDGKLSIRQLLPVVFVPLTGGH